MLDKLFGLQVIRSYLADGLPTYLRYWGWYRRARIFGREPLILQSLAVKSDDSLRDEIRFAHGSKLQFTLGSGHQSIAPILSLVRNEIDILLESRFAELGLHQRSRCSHWNNIFPATNTFLAISCITETEQAFTRTKHENFRDSRWSPRNHQYWGSKHQTLPPHAKEEVSKNVIAQLQEQNVRVGVFLPFKVPGHYAYLPQASWPQRYCGTVDFWNIGSHKEWFSLVIFNIENITMIYWKSDASSGSATLLQPTLARHENSASFHEWN
jgi:hypothetical protein